jgi:hypothetical protein
MSAVVGAVVVEEYMSVEAVAVVEEYRSVEAVLEE